MLARAGRVKKTHGCRASPARALAFSKAAPGLPPVASMKPARLYLNSSSVLPTDGMGTAACLGCRETSSTHTGPAWR